MKRLRFAPLLLALPLLAGAAPSRPKQGEPPVQRHPTAWIWQETGWPQPPRNLTDALRAGGFEVSAKTGAELAAKNALRSGSLDLLVLPHGRLYPVELASLLTGFCKRGGAVLTTGGRASLSQPVYATPAGARELTSAGEEIATLLPGPDWNKKMLGEGDQVSLETREGVLRADLNVLSFAYAGTVMAPLTAPDAVFVCEVRGDAETPRVCLEFQEQDGSRWKRMVPLTPEWTIHRFHLAEFAVYNSKVRGGEGDHLHPERINRFWMGVTKVMVGQGARRVELRGLRFLKAQVPSAQVVKAPRFVPEEASSARWFGAGLSCEPWLVTPPNSEKEREANLASGALTLHRLGPYAGSCWASFDFAGAQNELPAAVFKDVADAARALAAGVWQQAPQPVFRVDKGEVVMDVRLPLANPSPTAARLTVTLKTGKGQTHIREIALPARRTAFVNEVLAEGLSAPRLEQETLELVVDVGESTGPVLGPRRFQLDARGQLRATCDFMVEQARDDAKLHGYSFIDNRGMRALLGAYEILEDKRYLHTALRWGETMVAEQREDGGYRMGYGMTKKGEECYVADGGEIVVGVLRLACYAKGEQRERFLASADRYMAYRESFRVSTGGIGVGWCLNDYSKRPVGRLDTPTRIFAPEINNYTIGCSLAGAYGHAALRGDPALVRRAENDADWLMPRVKRINGAFAESFYFAHAFAGSAERRQLYAGYIDQTFLRPTLESPAAWWLSGGGRSALNLDGLAYCLHRLGAGPETRAEIYRALCAMYSPQSPQSIPAVIVAGNFNHDRWIYICFGTLGLVDVLEPMVSMDNWK